MTRVRPIGRVVRTWPVCFGQASSGSKRPAFRVAGFCPGYPGNTGLANILDLLLSLPASSSCRPEREHTLHKEGCLAVRVRFHRRYGCVGLLDLAGEMAPKTAKPAPSDGLELV